MTVKCCKGSRIGSQYCESVDNICEENDQKSSVWDKVTALREMWPYVGEMQTVIMYDMWRVGAT